MFQKILKKILLLILVTAFAPLVYALPTCGSLDFSLKSGSVWVPIPNAIAIDPGYSWSQRIRVQGGPGYNASKFNFEIIEELGGELSATWKEPRIGNLGKLDLVFTPSNSFGGRESGMVKFRVWHDYDPECISEVQTIQFYDASCNGIMSVTDVSDTARKTLSWGGRWDFWIDVNSVTGHGSPTPNYSASRLDGGNLGSLSTPSVSVIPGSTHQRLDFTYEHNGVMAGDEDIRIAIRDNNVSNRACDLIVIMKARVDAINYCQGFSADITASPDSINIGGSSIITVQGVTGENSSGQFIYRLLADSLPQSGSLDTYNVNATDKHEFTYTHDGTDTVAPGDILDSMTFEVVDKIHTQCKFTKTVNITRINYCSGFNVQTENVLTVGPGGATTIALRIENAVGNRFQYKIENQPEYGSITSDYDSGETSARTFNFEYLHDGTSEEDDVITIVVKDLDGECETTVTVRIRAVLACKDYMEGVGFENVPTTFDVLPNGEVSFIMAVQGSISGEYEYRIVGEPNYGSVTLVGKMNPVFPSTITTYSFLYIRDDSGSNATDYVTIEIYDPENPSCVITKTFEFKVVGICDFFRLDNPPNYYYSNKKPVNLGQWVTFVMLARFNVPGMSTIGRDYSYELVSPDPLEHGTIAMHAPDDNSQVRFTYQHNGLSANTDGTITLKVTDNETACETETTMTAYIGSLCTTFQSGVDDFGGTYSVGEVAQFKAWVSGGSGDFSFTVDQSTGQGIVSEGDQVIEGNRVTQSFNYAYDEMAKGVLNVTITDNEYECSQSFTADYDFKGALDNPSCQTLGLSLNPMGGQTVRVGRSFDFVATRLNGDADRLYQFDIVDLPTLGNITPLRVTANSEWAFRYNAPNNTLGSSTIRLQLKDVADELCPPIELSLNLIVDDPSDTCQGNEGTGQGSVLLDNTANANRRAIAANLKFLAGCGREESTIGYKTGGPDESGQGGNVINIKDFQIITRHEDKEKLKVYVGALHDVVDSLRISDASRKINYFKDGQQLFDLDQLRDAADWISSDGNLVNITAAAKGTSGTLTMQQFLKNIQDGKVMHGIVRVKIGLEKGTCGADCTRNAVGETVAPADLYGFCSGDNISGLCACAPSSRQDLTLGNHFDGITPGFELCQDDNGDSITLPAKSKIMVKGSLLWDFVDAETEEPIELAKLPFLPSKLYFKVNVPIVVNSAYDDDYCGGVNYAECMNNQVSSVMKSCLGTANSNNADRWDAYLNSSSLDPDFMEQMIYINDITEQAGSDPGVVVGINSGPIKFCMVPQSSKDIYKAIKGSTLTAALFSNLAYADQYHLLMPSGYVKRWAEAFSELGMTINQWKDFGFNAPTDASSLDEVTVRDDDFQDVPVYLYSGGLIDMHHHVSVSGLVYVPQALEMEAEAVSPAYQYIAGAILVRDGFYIKAKNNSITLLSAFPKSYSGVVTTTTIPQKINVSLARGSSSPLSSTPSSNNGGDGGNNSSDGQNDSGDGQNDSSSPGDCLFCSAAGGGEGSPVGPRRWQQVWPAAVP